MTETNYQKLAEEAGLARISGRLPFWKYLRETWRRRAFAISLARFQMDADYGTSRLGLSWIVIRPLLMVAVYGTVFGLILPGSTRPQPFIPFLVVGFFVFEYFSKSFSGGASSITGNRGLVRGLTFPRLLLPIAITIQRVLEMIPLVFVLFIIALAFGEPLSWSWLLAFPTLAVMTIFNVGVSLITARLTVHFRDVTQMLPFFTRIIFYTSGIFYSLDKVLADKPDLLEVVKLSPVHNYISLVRSQVLEGQAAEPTAWLLAGGAAVATLAFGLVFFWRAEERYGLE